MPTVVRWYVRTSLVYLAVALGLWLALAAGWLGPAWNPTALHLFFVGWVTQLIFGMAIWMLPTLSRAHPRGYEAVNWAVYILLNFGLVLRTVAEPQIQYVPGAPWSLLLLLSAWSQWLAGLGFVANAWYRVRGPRSQP